MTRRDIDVSRILDRLYLGSYEEGARQYKVLASLGITHVLTVGNNMLPMKPDMFEYMVVPIDDDPSVNISTYFDQCNGFIDICLGNPSNKILVHCYAGISRSATIVISYLITRFRLNLPEAYEMVRHVRHRIKPNFGFKMCLRAISFDMGDSGEHHVNYDACLSILELAHRQEWISHIELANVVSRFATIFGATSPMITRIKNELSPLLPGSDDLEPTRRAFV